MFIAVSPAATVESWMSCGATSYAARTSADVGVRCGAPGTSLSSLTVLTSPDAVSSVSGCFCELIAGEVVDEGRPSAGRRRSRDCTNTPSSLDECTSRSSMFRFLMTCECWLTHCVGSVCSTSLFSTRMPPDEHDHAARSRARARCRSGERSEPHGEPAERALAEVAALGRRLVLADAEDRERADDAVQRRSR